MSTLTDEQMRDLESLRAAWQAEDTPYTSSQSGAQLSGTIHDLLHAFGAEWDNEAGEYGNYVFPWERQKAKEE